jgi:hypothetical protein
MQSLRQRLMVGEDVEAPPIQQVPEVADTQERRQQFSVKRRVLQLCGVELLAEEGERSPCRTRELL